MSECLVLVVEDDPQIRFALKLILEDMGHRVLAAGSLAEALELAGETDKLDAIVADYRLKDRETGVMVIDRLRQLYGEEVDAVILTGETGPDRLKELAERGIEVLHKPTPVERLEKKVSGFCAEADAQEGKTVPHSTEHPPPA